MRCTRFLRCAGGAASSIPAGQGDAGGIPTISSINAKICPLNSWDRMKGTHDICFYYPRYQIESHIPESLPELISAKKALYEGEASGDSVEQVRRKVRSHLTRASEVFTSACGGDILAQTGAANAVRGYYVAVAGALAATTSPNSNKYQDFRTLANLAPAVRAIGGDTAIHGTDPNAFDACCMVVSAYTRAMTNQLMRGEWNNVDKLATACGVTIPNATTSGGASSFLPTPSDVLNAVEALQLSCMSLARSHSDEGHAISLRSAYNKLVGLAALLQIEINNDCSAAIDMITPLARMKGSNEIEKRMVETLRVELMRRAYGHGFGKDAVDAEVEAAYKFIGDFYLQYFRPYTPEGAVEMEAGKRVMLRDSYSMYLLSLSTMYTEIPHIDTAEQSWTPELRQKGLHLSPFVHVPCAETDPQKVVNFKITGSALPCAASRAKKLATAYADRSLRTNRKIFPEKRNNTRAAAGLRQLALCFTDVRDYLYASGMFNSATRTYEEIYGRVSEEHLEVLEKAMYMQELLKNEKEATATKHKIEAIREELDEKALKSSD